MELSMRPGLVAWWEIPLDIIPTSTYPRVVETILRPDSKGRVGLGSFTKALEEKFAGRAISGYAAEITDDGTIVLRPKVEVDAEQASTLILGAEDRDAFLSAIADPSPPSEALRAARKRHRRWVARS
jgi:hypothetical protein